MREEREELQAALAARHELGADHDAAVADAFLERIERQIDERVDARLATGAPRQPALNPGLTVASLGLAIPLTAIAGGIVGLAGIVAVWIGIVLVNFAYYRR